ncbi:alpha/beta fold hydrolase [Cumulibacter manganitolerans]|uniref:alpha/beta fold hydrolase n=1 Tax=Cumulibacter manganitolerans TaxID=1884992 RepID=UPI001295863D|nr:alpha/beta fold hydrolase [Cumulibacter manganitolerans]
MNTSQVSGGDGCAINVVAAGPEDGPLVVGIHGIGQSLLAYQPLLDVADERGWRVVAFDLRGHGDSDKPHDAYGDSQLWADDVKAVLEWADASADNRATVLAWSYGGAVITDYLGAYGDELVRAIVTLGATDKLGGPVSAFVTPQFGKLGKAIMTDDTGAVADELLTMCAAKPLDPAYRKALLEGAMKCPAYVRNGMFRRTLDNDEALASYGGVVLATHGDQDQMFFPDLGKHLAEVAKNGRFKGYAGCGHMPLWDVTDEFLEDVASVVD